jgi:YidC/Oxa1 family membrane protein insertase
MLDNKNLLITIFLSTAILLGWQYFFENPRIEQLNQIKQEQVEVQIKEQEKTQEIILDRSQVINSSGSNRITIDNGKLKGSINLQGFAIDDLSLLDYQETIDLESKNVVLLSPSGTKDSYFAEFGFVSDNQAIELPNATTIWKSDKDTLNANEAATLTWKNQQDIIFNIVVSLDDNYMFTIKQSVLNNSHNPISISQYGLINRKMEQVPASQSILHEGAIGSFKSILFEKSYTDLKDSETKQFDQNQKGDWLGITDKYWLSSIVPQGEFTTKITRKTSDVKNIFQIDYISKSSSIASGASHEDKVYFFAGAKNLKQLDQYANDYQINLFDRAVDFGWFYFLTKPMFLAIQFLDLMTGNFGIAILLLTVAIKLIMFPLANKSYHSMNRMKALNPEINKLKERYADDKTQLNKETMELYKKEGINPLSGCLPLILQIPVFFSLYKVLFVTIEMRHAPFFGWIHDLSAPDPTTLFNLFGLISWNPPSFLMIGAWPIIMAITMYIQQKLSPQPSDPVQAQVMKFLPLFFVFMFGSFPAGLVIYWAWNNILSVLQQLMIDRKTIKI